VNVCVQQQDKIMHFHQWINDRDTVYYVRSQDGRILGSVWRMVSQNVMHSCKIFLDEIPFTNASEVYLGHYDSLQSAKCRVEQYWLTESRTVLELNHDSSN